LSLRIYISNDRPYDDGYIIASQVLAIITPFVAWVFWGTFIVNFAGLTMFQIPWCCRQNKAALYGSVAVALFTSLGSIAVGVYVMIKWHYKGYCEPFYFYVSSRTIDPEYDDYYCAAKAWAGVSFACAILWIAAAVCLFFFAKTGRHAKWEELHSKDAEPAIANNSVELPAVLPAASVGAPAVATAVLESAEAGKADIAD